MKKQTEKFDKAKLYEVLQSFYLDIRTEDDNYYKASSLENLRHSLGRVLKSQNSEMDFIKDCEFTSANKSYRAAIKEAKAIGKDRIDHYPVISEVYIKKLYDSFTDSLDTPSKIAEQSAVRY